MAESIELPPSAPNTHLKLETPGKRLFPYLPKTPGMYWNKLKMQTSLSSKSAADKNKKKQQSYTSAAVGRYSFLNKVWSPVHRICFLDPYIIKNEKELFKVTLATLFSIKYVRKILYFDPLPLVQTCLLLATHPWMSNFDCPQCTFYWAMYSKNWLAIKHSDTDDDLSPIPLSLIAISIGEKLEGA